MHSCPRRYPASVENTRVSAADKVFRNDNGSARPWADFPRLVNLYMANRLSIDPMISRTYHLQEINEAYEALDKGEMARSIILFD